MELVVFIRLVIIVQKLSLTAAPQVLLKTYITNMFTTGANYRKFYWML